MITRRFLHPYLKQISVIKRSQHIEAAKSKSEHYQVLDVPPNATLTEIREAYYRKVKICHPDINPSEEAKRQFTIVQEAYKILSNVDRRIGYDRSMPSSSNKRDEVKAETIDEQEARIAKKVEDTEVYHQTKKDLNPSRSWSALDEWGSGGRCIRLDKEINRMSDTEKEEIVKASSIVKLGDVTEKFGLGEFFKKLDVGGPDGIRISAEKDGLIDAAKHARNYVGLAIVIFIVFFANQYTKYGLFNPSEWDPSQESMEASQKQSLSLKKLITSDYHLQFQANPKQ